MRSSYNPWHHLPLAYLLSCYSDSESNSDSHHNDAMASGKYSEHSKQVEGRRGEGASVAGTSTRTLSTLGRFYISCDLWSMLNLMCVSGTIVSLVFAYTWSAIGVVAAGCRMLASSRHCNMMFRMRACCGSFASCEMPAYSFMTHRDAPMIGVSKCQSLHQSS